MAFKLKDLEGRLGEIIQSVTVDRDFILFEERDRFRIMREQGCVYIQDLDVDVYSAVTCVYDEDTKEYEIDSDLYLFCEHDTTNEVYSEWGSSLPVCVHNYARYIGRFDLSDMDAVENMDCVYCLNWHKSLE